MATFRFAAILANEPISKDTRGAVIRSPFCWMSTSNLPKKNMRKSPRMSTRSPTQSTSPGRRSAIFASALATLLVVSTAPRPVPKMPVTIREMSDVTEFHVNLHPPSGVWSAAAWAALARFGRLTDAKYAAMLRMLPRLMRDVAEWRGMSCVCCLHLACKII
jgi:hypothetical protein